MLACCVDVEVRTSTDASHMSGNDWLGEEERRRKAEKRREKREEGNRQGGRWSTKPGNHTRSHKRLHKSNTRDATTSKPTVANVLAQPLLYSRSSFCVISMTTVKITRRFGRGSFSFCIGIPLSQLAWVKPHWTVRKASDQVDDNTSAKLHVVIENYNARRSLRVQRNCIWTANYNALLRTRPSSGLDGKWTASTSSRAIGLF